MTSFKCLFENTKFVVPDPKIFFWAAASVAEVAVVNSKGTKTLLLNGLSIFHITDRPAFSNGLRSLPRNPPNCIILDNWDFKDFVLADEPFEKVLQFFKTCVLVNNDLWGKLVSFRFSSEKKFRRVVELRRKKVVIYGSLIIVFNSSVISW